MVFRLLDLPLDLLRRVSTTLDSPAIVVACSTRERDAERRALRLGADDHERGRWGLTVREAEEKLVASSRRGVTGRTTSQRE